jgi:hypothetical protein
MGSTATASHPPEPEQEAPLLGVDIDGGLVRLRTCYDPQLVERLRRLPGRRFIAERGEWVLPARRAGLAALAGLLVELGGQAELSERARRRLERQGPGRIEVREGEFELSVRPRPELVERIRALPERRYRAERRGWRVAPTRAGALALLALVEDGELVATPATLSRLRRLAAGQAAAGGPERGRAADVAAAAARRRAHTGATSPAAPSSGRTRTATSGSRGSAGACSCGSTPSDETASGSGNTTDRRAPPSRRPVGAHPGSPGCGHGPDHAQREQCDERAATARRAGRSAGAAGTSGPAPPRRRRQPGAGGGADARAETRARRAGGRGRRAKSSDAAAGR